MTTPLLLAILSTVLQLSGYVLYTRAAWSKSIRPNLSSWLVWGGISLINTASYFSLNSHDFIVSLMPFTITVVNVFTLIVIMSRGSFQRISTVDAAALGIATAAIVSWQLTSSPILANLTIQVAILVGTVPTVLGVWRDPSAERPLPWFLWSTAFMVAIIVITLRHAPPAAYASPVLQHIMYEAIAWLARRSSIPKRLTV